MRFVIFDIKYYETIAGEREEQFTIRGLTETQMKLVKEICIRNGLDYLVKKYDPK